MKAKKVKKIQDLEKSKLVKELQTHQAELEAQQAELEASMQDAQTAMERYSDLYDFAPVCLLSLNHKFRVLECNMATEELLGYARAYLINKDLRLFILPKSQYAFREFVRQVFDSPRKHYLELELRGKKGKPISCQAVGVSLNDNPGQLKQCRIALTDISLQKAKQEEIRQLNIRLFSINQGLENEIVERKKIEENLRESREKYAGLFTNMTDGFAYNKIFFNKKGVPVDYMTLEVNDAFETVTRLKRQDVVGKKVTEALPLIEKELDVWINQYGKAILSGKKIRFETFVSVLGRWLAVSAYSPETGYFALILQDITQRKQAEEELLRANELLEAVTTGNKVLIAAVDKDLRYTYFNQEHHEELKRLTGKKTRIGMSMMEVLADMPDQLKSTLDLWGRALKGETVVQTTEFGDPGRYQRIYQTQHTPIRDNVGNIIGAGEVTIDVTNQKKNEQKMHEIEMRLNIARATEKERQRLYDVLETLPVYVILLSKDYHVPFANKFFRERFGESHGKCCYEYLFNRSEPCENCESYKVLKTNKNHHWEWSGPDKRNYDIYDYPFTDTDGSKMILEMGVDITETKQAEAALKSERKRLFEVLETLPTMVCLLNADYHVAFANRAFRLRFGEAKGKHCYEYCYGKNQPCDFCESYKVLETGKPHHWEVNPPDGTVIDVYDYPFTDVDGSRMILEMDVDITEVRRAQAALQKAHDELEKRVQERTQELMESRESFSRIVHTANEGIIVYALDGRINFANRRMAEMLGYSDPEELVGRIPLEDFVEPDDKALIMKIRQDLNRRSNLQVEFRFHRKDGSIFWVNSSAAPLVDEQGNHFANLAMYTDITERKHAEAAVGQSEERLRLAQEAGNVGVWDWNPATGEVRWSPELEKIYGLEPGTVRKYADFVARVHPDDVKQVENIRDKAVEQHTPFEFEFRIMLPQGGTRWIYCRGRGQYEQDGGPIRIFGVNIDITERKKIEETMKKNNDELQRLNQTMVGRELRMIELKKEINDLLAKINNPPRYPLDFEKDNRRKES